MHAGGEIIGRRAWMNTYHAFRRAGLDDRALAVLDYCEANAPEVERHSIEGERGELAEDDGDLVAAVEHFDRAYELSDGFAFYGNRADELRAELAGRQPAVVGEGGGRGAIEELPSIEAIGDLMTMGQAYVQVYDSQVDAYVAEGQPARAATALRGTLLFVDDVIERARLLLTISELQLAAGHWDDALATQREIMQHVTAKPFPYTVIRLGHTESLATSAAHGMCAAWRGQGLDPEAIQARAWGLPWFYSARQGAALFRIGLFADLGRADALLRETEMLLLADPAHPLAQWWRLFALESLGRHAELPMAMRDIIEDFNRQGSAEHLWLQLVERMQAEPERQDNPKDWYDVAVADLMRGRFGEASGMFEQARARTTDPAEAARYLSWSARAAQVAGTPDGPDRVRALLTEAAALNPADALIALRLATLP
jgi:tetratricopeptide (TPR) repeat protein